MLDHRQRIFDEFRVPDRGRVLKVRNWLRRNRYLDPGRKISLLEIGYARGGLIDNLDEYKNVEKYAVDINDRTGEGDITFYRYDCNQGLPDFDGKLFDILFAGEVIEHLFDDEKFLRECYKVLRPGGVLALTTPNLFFLVNRILFPFGKMPYFAYEQYHYHFYDIDTLYRMVRSCGFSVRHVTSSHILISSRRSKYIGRIFEFLGSLCPFLGAHIILFAVRP
ncbi:MAG TPA: class I SAM-dependent methyltransferase [Thermodesulfobacteriota bacterium]|nr:class I SAM-dependent methyltransferase [Thermodesulfobacteriota bacterium]